MKKILFVDDEVDLITMVQTRIEAFDYKFLSAQDGEEGLKVTLDEKPDLILLDIIMPKMNGYEMCVCLKNDEETKNIPVIIVTASGTKGLQEKCLEAGAEEVITKPFDSTHLMERIKFYLND